MAKTTKTRNFPDKTLPFDDSKQTSPVSDQVLDKSDVQFRRKCMKTWFSCENGQILNQQVRLAMVPRNSQQRPQLYDQLTWNLHEILMNSY